MVHLPLDLIIDALDDSMPESPSLTTDELLQCLDSIVNFKETSIFKEILNDSEYLRDP